jgi:hypothetical protein
MENNYQTDPTMNPQPKSKNGLMVLLIILILGLVVTIVVLLRKTSNQTYKIETDQEEKAYIKHEKDSLTVVLQDIIKGYDTLKVDNEDMQQKITAQKEEISKLLKYNGSNIALITKYKAELGTLKDVLRSYIAQVDSLNTQNQQLIQENTQINSKLDQARSEISEKTTKIDELSSKVKEGSVLLLRNVSSAPVDADDDVVSKLKKVKKVKVSMTIQENRLAEAGQKTIYIRIKGPSNAVFAESETSLCAFGDEQIVYTAKREITYEKKEIDVNIYWDPKNLLAKAKYTVDIIAEGNLIGTSTFELKK